MAKSSRGGRGAARRLRWLLFGVVIGVGVGFAYGLTKPRERA